MASSSPGGREPVGAKPSYGSGNRPEIQRIPALTGTEKVAGIRPRQGGIPPGARDRWDAPAVRHGRSRPCGETMGGEMQRHELRFGLLGPPVLHLPGGEVRPIGSPKVRALLAALLLDAGRVVSVESLKDALWGGA